MAARKVTKKKTTKRASVVRNRGGGRYTESEYWAFIRSGLRAKNNRWPVKYDCLNAAKRPYKGPNKRQKYEWQCNVCKEWVTGKEIQADHVIPSGRLSKPEDLMTFVPLLFCEMDNYQAICSTCHSIKTAEERKKKEDGK